MTEGPLGGAGPDAGRALDEAFRAAVEVPELLVASDFDGVLAPIVADPAAVSANRISMAALHRLAAVPGTTVAVVSGRDYDTLARFVGPRGALELIGSHGAQPAPGPTVLTPVERATLAATTSELAALAQRHAGFHVEEKPLSVAAHLRRVIDDRDGAAAAVAELVKRWPGKVVAGKEVVEFTVRHTTKGEAVRALADRIGADAVVYLGDDVTDEDVFVMLEPRDVGIKVGDGPTAARHRVAGPDEVTEVLATMATHRELAFGDARPGS
ncbi:MAG: trehalose-phosphatase [Actinomycetota bacterium]